MSQIIKTTTGTTWRIDKPVHCSGLTMLNANGNSEFQPCYIIGVAGTHFEFGEEKVDLIVCDQFGERHEICEDFVWHF